MKLTKMTATTAMILLALIITPAAVSAAPPTTRAQERAMERLQLAASEHVRILTDLQAQLPAQAKADLSTAIAAADKGLQQAMALHVPDTTEAASVTKGSRGDRSEAGDTEAEVEETPETPEDTPDGDTPEGESPDHTTGLVHAREQVAASFEKSIAVLTGVMAKVPEQAAAKIQAAITRIQENRARALANMDRVMAGEHPQKPEHPEKASRPERGERPQKPERAERPARPEHPRP